MNDVCFSIRQCFGSIFSLRSVHTVHTPELIRNHFLILVTINSLLWQSNLSLFGLFHGLENFPCRFSRGVTNSDEFFHLHFANLLYQFVNCYLQSDEWKWLRSFEKGIDYFCLWKSFFDVWLHEGNHLPNLLSCRQIVALPAGFLLLQKR